MGEGVEKRVNKKGEEREVGGRTMGYGRRGRFEGVE